MQILIIDPDEDPEAEADLVVKQVGECLSDVRLEMTARSPAALSPAMRQCSQQGTSSK